MKIKVCTCEQCKYQKNLRKNRRVKKIIKKLMNTKRRNGKEKYFNYYWA